MAAFGNNTVSQQKVIDWCIGELEYWSIEKDQKTIFYSLLHFSISPIFSFRLLYCKTKYYFLDIKYIQLKMESITSLINTICLTIAPHDKL